MAEGKGCPESGERAVSGPKKNGKSRKPSGELSGKAVVGYGKNNNLTPGNPGSKGGGRVPHRVRQIAREAFADRIYILEEIADDKEERSTDRIAALKLMSDTGGVDKLALTLDEQPERELSPERVKDLWESLQMIKSIKEFERMLVAAAAKQIEGV